jgi:hypothetical protein
MVRLSIFVRPKTGYSSAKKIRSISVDSSQRLEQIIADLKLPKKGTLLYANGTELPLNSSLASHNIQDGDVLESCSSPLMSAILSAVLQDLNDVEAIPEDQRTKSQIQPLLDQVQMDPWPDRWSFDAIKTRKICLATMKKVLQRDDRFADKQVPQCQDLMSLYNFMPTVWYPNGGRSRGHNSMAHVFKPSAKNRDGKPTICWELLQNKLNKVHRMTSRLPPNTDIIEGFVKAENERHQTATPESTNRRAAKRSRVGSTPRIRRRLLLTPSPGQGASTCSTCGSQADSICLDSSCPFHHQLSCTTCFGANHPLHVRNHERVPLDDRRARLVTRAQNRPRYCPEYASGPFAILCTLYEATNAQRRELSLSESRLKKMAQGRCRSNLYDRQARGRNAFACIESLTDKGLVRKELIPGITEAKYSLLPDGEQMAKCCFQFERALEDILENSEMKNDRNAALGGRSTNVDASLIVDTREDTTYAERLVERCRDSGIDSDRRALPAGDYLFTMMRDAEEKVLPLVIERKSWSDLADSVNGAGKGHRRLDCVRIHGDGRCPRGRCQLCRMKASGCSKVMFIIEGARCLGRDHEDKCSDASRCKYCRELVERHGTNLHHEELERVLYKLQVEHGCLIHFTRGYNETIDSLFIIRKILCRNLDATSSPVQDSDESGAPINNPTEQLLALSYEQFCSNARRSSSEETRISLRRGRIVQWNAETFINRICKGILGESIADGFAVGTTSASRPARNLNEDFSATVANSRIQGTKNRDEDSQTRSKEIVIDDDDDSNENIVDLQKAPHRNDIVIIDSEEEDELENSQDSIYVLDDAGWRSTPKRKASETSRSNKATSESPCIEIHSDEDPEQAEHSQDSLVVIECPVTKKPRIDDTDAVIVVDQPARKTTSTGQTNRTCDISTRDTAGLHAPLILISGMYEYDKEYYDDVSKVWQTTYRNHLNASAATPGSTREQNFVYLAREELQALEVLDSEAPLVQRDTVLFWILYLQLSTTARLHLTRQRSGMRELQSHWRRRVEAMGGSAKRAVRSDEQGAQRSLFATPAVDCKICEEPLETSELDVTTPCGHCFHRHCLHRWLHRSKSRSCPVCKYEGIGAPKDDTLSGIDSTPSRTTGQSAPTRSSKQRSSGTTTSIREARLRRFGESDTVATTNIDGTADAGWSCATCTLSNKSTSSNCEACGLDSPWKESIVSGALLPVPSDPPAHCPKWTCDHCTLENELNTPTCEACHARNPCYTLDSSDSVTPERHSSRGSAKPQTRELALPPRPPRNHVSYAAPASRAASPNTRPKSKAKCGACGQQGHNRGTATAQNCPAYYQSEEVESRQKKKEGADRKAREAREEAESLQQSVEQSKASRDTRMVQIQQMLADQQRENEEMGRISESEVRRRQQEAARAEKRARRLDR